MAIPVFYRFVSLIQLDGHKHILFVGKDAALQRFWDELTNYIVKGLLVNHYSVGMNLPHRQLFILDGTLHFIREDNPIVWKEDRYYVKGFAEDVPIFYIS